MQRKQSPISSQIKNLNSVKLLGASADGPGAAAPGARGGSAIPQTHTWKARWDPQAARVSQGLPICISAWPQIQQVTTARGERAASHGS